MSLLTADPRRSARSPSPWAGIGGRLSAYDWWLLGLTEWTTTASDQSKYNTRKMISLQCEYDPLAIYDYTTIRLRYDNNTIIKLLRHKTKRTTKPKTTQIMLIHSKGSIQVQYCTPHHTLLHSRCVPLGCPGLDVTRCAEGFSDK